MLNNSLKYNKQNILYDTFCFTVQTTAPNETFALPLFADGTYNFACHWGDDSEDTITVYNQAEVTHTYASAGTYRIQISGICTKFAFDNGGDCAKVRKVLNVPDLGFTKLNFYGCSGLTEVKRPFRKLAITDLSNLFNGCNISAILTNLLKNATACTNVTNALKDNINMTGNGLDFIAACPASITTGTTTGCFSGDTSLSDYNSIPASWGGPVIPDTLTINNAGTGTLSYAGAFAKSGADGWDGSGAYISEKAGVCHVEFKASQTDKYIIAGLTDTYSSLVMANFDYCFYCQVDGLYQIFEDDVVKTDPVAYTANSIFEIIYDGTDITYYVDDILIRTVNSVSKELTLMIVAYSQNAALSVTEFREE